MKKSFFPLLGAALWCCACAAAPPVEEPPAPVVAVPVPVPEPEKPEPVILEPEFSISSIVILQAELINTRFKVRVRVDNPNSFPLELSEFSYELYGAGRYWAEGKETDPLEIPPEGHAEKDLFLLMNFINMKRDVLDRIVALKTVDYRFSGSVAVRGGGDSLQRFTMRFDRSGKSPVEQ
jgi:LEA14-like dessication related protein